MGELHQEFLKQSISNLETLQTEFEEDSSDTLGEDFLRRFFRILHTIKGTANTFNLFYLAKLAHETENLLQAIQKDQIPQTAETTAVFRESFVRLLQTAQNYLNESEISFSNDFSEKLKALIPEKSGSDDLLIFQIPQRILARLSVQEKDALNLAIQKGNNFYLLKVSFPLQDFSREFKNFKEILNQSGEVIAVSSSPNRNPAQEINFQVFFTAFLKRAEVENLIEGFSAQIEFKTLSAAPKIPQNLTGMLENLVNYGEKTAQFLNKNIAFETDFSDAQISTNHLILLNEVALHLLHNAIDHAIEPIEERTLLGKSPTAKIKITLKSLPDELFFEIEDDGSGINVEKIIALAKEKGFLPNSEKTMEKEALDLIFAQGFSTSQSVSEISGRGVGLDAVKDLLEKSGGRIEVETKTGFGSIFSVYLPSA